MLAGIGVSRVTLQHDRVDIAVTTSALLDACGISSADHREATIILTAPVTRVRGGHELRLIIPGERSGPSEPLRDERLVALLSDAMTARAIVLAAPDQPISRIAIDHGRCRTRLTQLVKLSWLAPEIVRSILVGQQPPTLTPARLLELDLPTDWREQRTMLAAG